MCIGVPDELDPVIAAAIGNPGMSSWVALTIRASFVAGENILILGATGIAGQLAIQIAKRLGAARVIAAGRNRAALEKLADLGADAIISLDQEYNSVVSAIRHESASGIDVVLDYVWGPPAQAALEALSKTGLQRPRSRLRFVQIGDSAGKTITLPAAVLRSSSIELLGSGFGSAPIDEIFKALAEFLKFAGRHI